MDGWIKIRAALLESQKTIAVARHLQEHSGFRGWLGAPVTGPVLSPMALRCVTLALLVKVWSVARGEGKYRDSDLVLEHLWIDDLDQIAGAPGVGQAMQAVGWAVTDPDGKGIFLPNFKEFNVPLTDAEKQKNYRDRQRESRDGPLPTRGNEKAQNVTPRVEKSREEQKPKSSRAPKAHTLFQEFWEKWPNTARRVAKASCLDTWTRRGYDQVAPAIMAHVEVMKTSKDWIDGFEPAPLTYLRGRRWEDGNQASDVAATNAGRPWYISKSGIEAKAKELGVAEYVDGEPWAMWRDRVYAKAGVTTEMIEKAKKDHGLTR